MAVSLDALLTLKAQVSGTAAVQGMAGSIGGVRQSAGLASGAMRSLASSSGEAQRSASQASGSMNQLASSASGIQRSASQADGALRSLSTSAAVSLSRTVGSVRQLASQTTGAIRGVSGALSGLSGPLQLLMPLLSFSGMAALAKSTMDSGRELYILSQRTGVAVETLAKFKKAASSTGTDLDAVGRGLVRLGIGLKEAATTGKGPAADALKELGINARDARGNIKSADAVLLEIAAKLKALPVEANRAALAVALFGKGGAELVPFLNLGGDAISRLTTKMSGDFAQRLNEYGNRLTNLGGKVSALGANFLKILLPALEKTVDVLTSGVETLNKLPDWAQGTIVVITGLAMALIGLLPAIASIVQIGSTLGLTFVGIKSILAGIGTVLSVIFTGPVGWAVLLIGAGVALYAFRDKIGGFLKWLFDTWLSTITAVGKFFYDLLVKPNIDAAQALWDMLRGGWTTFSSWVGGAFTAMGKLFGDYVVKPVVSAWNSIVNACKAPLNAILSFAGSVINGYINMLNGMIGKVNGITKSIGIPAIGIIPQVTVPSFAEGAFVTGPTYAQIGEGRDDEYVLPAGKVSGFINNYQAGARGASAIPTSSGGSSSGGGGGGGTFAPVFNLTTGPVLQRDGENWVTIRDAQLIARQSCEQLYAQLRTPAGRRSLGVKHG